MATKTCVRCDRPIKKPHLRPEEGEICGSCIDDGTQIDSDADDIPACAQSMGCLCAGHARGNPAGDPCDTRETVQHQNVDDCPACAIEEVAPIHCDKCPKRDLRAAVAVIRCCDKVYARCVAHGGMKGANRSRGAHRGLTGCQARGAAKGAV